ncbi:hypothetical protein, partial [Bradyrhizobium sp. SHOUNA76]|uniref:hypothetical protein n=1 Tax=Bradyrhizobium sp. SHOUNA76 TaxID=2908927 RepID=UPI001FF45CE3
MTTSNSKFRNTKEAPTEPFKRSVASCLKAIAKTPELSPFQQPRSSMGGGNSCFSCSCLAQPRSGSRQVS